MNKKLRMKIIIFTLLSFVGIFIIAYTKYEEKNKLKEIDEKQQFILKEKKEENAKITASNERNEELDSKNQEALTKFYDGKYTEAIEKCDEVIDLDENNYKAYNIKGIAIGYKGDFEKGLECIDKSLDINPDFGYSKFNKALIYELFGKYEESLKLYDDALKVEEYVWSYYGKASIYGRYGDLENTLKFMKKAIEIDPKVKEAAKEEIDFNNVRKYKEFNDLINFWNLKELNLYLKYPLSIGSVLLSNIKIIFYKR